MKKYILVLLFLADASLMLAQDGIIRIEIEACIDGKSRLCLKDDKIWWEHVSYDPPGTHLSCETENSVNGKRWKDWKKEFKLRFSLNEDSLLFVEKLSSANCCIKVRPGRDNNWQTVIELDDEVSEGPQTYKLVLVFKALGNRSTEHQTMVGSGNTLLDDCLKKETSKSKTQRKVKPAPEKENEIKIDLEQPLVLNNIYFESGRSDLLPGSFLELDRVVKELLKNDFKFMICGHTDNAGDPAKNLRLSEERAKAVYNYFLEKGIAAGRMSYSGYGDKFPLDFSETDEGRRKNRRVELKIMNETKK